MQADSDGFTKNNYRNFAESQKVSLRKMGTGVHHIIFALREHFVITPGIMVKNW